MPRPKSLSGLMLVGFTIVAAPLLFAIVNAAVQMNRLSNRSEQLVIHGMQGTRNNQVLFEQISALERSARLYRIIGNTDFLDAYARNNARLNLAAKELYDLPVNDESRADLNVLQGETLRLLQELKEAPPNSPRMATAIDAFAPLTDLVTKISDRTNAQIDAELSSLQLQAERAQQHLFWQTLLLVPMTLAVVGLFTYLFGRPIRAIDRAISELGRGTFSRPIAISGPADLERLAAQLEWLRGRLLDLAQEKNRFLRHMSHELKTPLANIREGTELLMDGAVGELQSAQREVTAILRDNGMKLQRLIENLLSFSAWQAKSVGLEITEFKLRPLIKSVLENQQLTLVAQRVRLDVQVEDLTPMADRGKLRLILDNLLSNAIKFTPRGGTISIHARAERGQLVMDVMDSGPGIPAEERGRIFEAFYQGKTPQGGHVKGTGIGLSVVTEFVNAHGGSIEILEAKAGGAHFRVRLPLHPSATAAREKAHAA
ncbi:MAG: ATP-binding protein [Steroidobacteraceae bacterium]|jgi:two-component system, NtrC family, sensor histidine kinase GlrK